MVGSQLQGCNVDGINPISAWIRSKMSQTFNHKIKEMEKKMKTLNSKMPMLYTSRFLNRNFYFTAPQSTDLTQCTMAVTFDLYCHNCSVNVIINMSQYWGKIKRRKIMLDAQMVHCISSAHWGETFTFLIFYRLMQCDAQWLTECLPQFL